MGANLERGSLLHKRYRIVEILGQGGMGSVYRAVDENLGVDVAVKENLFTSDEYARQFRLEAVILANLRQTNLPRVTDHFVINGQGQYLIMDYIEGEDLRERMERTGFIFDEEAVLIGAAMCDALQYLHTRKPSIIHRDLKPGNVRIAPDGHIYLVDFGLVKLLKGGQATTTGARAMTPGYSPPEQYGTARTDPRTDIYSLGATLYAALTGVIPEDGLARAMDNLKLTPLRKRNSKVSHKLAAAIEKAMAVRPEDRFQSAEEFKQALLASNVKTQQLEGGLDITPSPQVKKVGDDSNLTGEISNDTGYGTGLPPPSIPGTKVYHTSRWLFFTFFLLTILLMLLVAILVPQSPFRKAFRGLTATSTSMATSTSKPTSMATSTSSSTPKPSLVTPTVQVSNTFLPPPPKAITATLQSSFSFTWTPLPTFIPSITPTPTATFGPTPTSLGGGYGQIAFATDRDGLPQIYIMNADGSDPRKKTNMNYGACQPDWSPDGAQFIFISPCPKRQEQFQGEKIYDKYWGAVMYTLNADGIGTVVGLPSKEGGDFDPAWSPDGTRIAFTSLRDGSPQIYIMNLGDKSVTRLTEASSDINLPDWSMQPDWSPSGSQIIYTGHSRLTDALQIWVMSETGKGKKFLSRRGSELWNFLPDWSPDGKTILFSETKGAQQLGWLILFDYEHQDVNAVHLRGGVLGTHGNYSPDGLWVTYESKDSVDIERLDYDIYRIKADGSGEIIRITDAHSMEFDPAWRPIMKP